MAQQLPAELVQFVEDEIASGRYRSEEEVITEGLALLRQRRTRLHALRKDLAPALSRLDNGEGQELDLETVKTRGRKRLENFQG